MYTKYQRLLFLFFLCFFVKKVGAQSADESYLNTVKERAYKIVATLNIQDSLKFFRVRDIIADEYVDIKTIDDKKETDLKKIKSENLNKEDAASSVQKITDASEQQRTDLNKSFLQKLSKELNENQIEAVKNGLTYNVLPITYKGYVEMIPSLTSEEKQYIQDALVEAREHAMAAGSSEAKHGWFGKCKGRINNYLSKHGYDMNKESRDWQDRIKAEKKL